MSRPREKKRPMTALQRRYANASSTPRPPDGIPTRDCWCGGKYLDSQGGLDSHEIVFGHRPGDRFADVTEAPEEGDDE